jgi:predicted TIM-barrel fold metal-dependent hydrolase
MARLAFPVFDADNHLYETREALTKYLPEERAGAIDFVDVHGRTKITVNGQISNYIPNPTFDRVGRPGAMASYFRDGNPEGKSYREIVGHGIDCPDAFRNASARLELMNEQGIDFAMMYPTLASLIEERMRDDPDLCADAVHALNRWMTEAWPYVFENRIFATPVIATGLVDRALRELDYVVEHGARAVLVRPAPAWGYRGPRSFALPEFDPLWKRVEEAGLVVVLHASDSGYVRYTNEWDGQTGEALAFGEASLFSMVVEGDYRAIRDAATSVICHGMLERFPKLRLLMVENGGGWVPHLLETLDHGYQRAPHRYPEHPAETFKRHFWMHPFHEEDPRMLVDLLGADRVVFGSDFPHIEGLADPVSWVKELDGLPDDQVQLVMGGNMLNLFGIETAGV